MNDRNAILQALGAFARQRPGLDPRNYISHGMDREGRSAYRSECRSITRDLHDVNALLAAVSWRESITAQDLREAAERAYSGRLSIVDTPKGIGLDYCTGQYWPTEYRKAVCAVLSHALWYYWRKDVGGVEHKADHIRKIARRELGSGIASRWFS